MLPALGEQVTSQSATLLMTEAKYKVPCLAQVHVSVKDQERMALGGSQAAVKGGTTTTPIESWGPLRKPAYPTGDTG